MMSKDRPRAEIAQEPTHRAHDAQKYERISTDSAAHYAHEPLVNAVFDEQHFFVPRRVGRRADMRAQEPRYERRTDNNCEYTREESIQAQTRDQRAKEQAA